MTHNNLVDCALISLHAESPRRIEDLANGLCFFPLQSKVDWVLRHESQRTIVSGVCGKDGLLSKNAISQC